MPVGCILRWYLILYTIKLLFKLIKCNKQMLLNSLILRNLNFILRPNQ